MTLEILAKLIVHTDAIHPIMIAIVKDRRLVSHEDYYTKAHVEPHAAAVRFHTVPDRKTFPLTLMRNGYMSIQERPSTVARAVLFDLDGVLIRSIIPDEQSWFKWAKAP